MFKSLYIRIVVYYFAAVLISVIFGLVAALFLFQQSSYQDVQFELQEKAEHIIQVYEQSKPDDKSVFLENMAILASVGLKFTDSNSQELLRFNWPTGDDFCDCEASVQIPWTIDGENFQIQLIQQSEEESGLKEIALILVIVLTVGGLFMLLSASYLVKPIKAVTTASKQIATGNFSVRLTEYRQDELGVLSTAINHMAKELGQLDVERQEFVANVSHEFQSPLTLIKGFSVMLLEETLEESERQRSLQIIIQESERLSKLSENLLRLTSLESEQLSITSTTFDLTEQIRLTVLAFEPLWLDKQLEVKLDASIIMINAYQELLNQVWVNLISNAIKFSPAGGMIHIDIQEYDFNVEVRVTDNGISIPKDELERIFSRFYKADRARNRKVEGNGLGLSIVKKIIDIHNGSICVAADSANSKSFVVKIPRNARNDIAESREVL